MIRQRVEPLVTVAPTCALRLWSPCRSGGRSAAVPSSSPPAPPPGRRPAPTSPSATATLTIVPCIGEVSASPDGPLAAPPPPAPPRRTGLAGRLGAAVPFTAPRPAGTTTSSRLPLTSTTTLDFSTGSGAASTRPGVRGDLGAELGLDPAGMHPEVPVGGHEGRVVEHGPVERQHRRHALDHQLAQGPPGPGQRLGAVGAGHDDLGHQGVEAARHGHPGPVALVDPYAGAGRRPPGGEGARGRHEVAPGVLGVDPELDGVPGHRRVRRSRWPRPRRSGTSPAPGPAR